MSDGVGDVAIVNILQRKKKTLVNAMEDRRDAIHIKKVKMNCTPNKSVSGVLSRKRL